MAVAFLKFGASKCPTLSFKPQRNARPLVVFLSRYREEACLPAHNIRQDNTFLLKSGNA